MIHYMKQLCNIQPKKWHIFISAHDRAELELDSVAVDWVNWRLSRHCNVCKREFDSSATGVSTHCRRCGQLYCMRCIPRYLLYLEFSLRRRVCQ